MNQNGNAGSHHEGVAFPQVALRSPDTVMKLARMGSAFPTRLSFMRTLVRNLAREKVTVRCPVWEMDQEGYGRAVYSIDFGGHTYSLVAFSNRIEPDQRTDRVIAEVWDSAFTLFDGVPTTEDVDRLEQNAPRQEAGRFRDSELVLSRANKSLRLFEHVAQRLASGLQPDEEMIASIGYLMRTTAVYGNGKFGIADRSKIAKRKYLSGPFQIEMLTVWLIRKFTHDLVEYVAKCRNPQKAVKLDQRLKRHLGIGNSTGLGMAPFLVSHPILLNNWMQVRETALARVRAIETADQKSKEHFLKLLERCKQHFDQWNVVDEIQMARIVQLRAELPEVVSQVDEKFLSWPNPWNRLVELSSQWSMECQEFLIAAILEPHGELVDGLADCLASDIEPRLDPAMSISELETLMDTAYDWALKIDLTAEKEMQQFWYVSEEKLEPRLGERFNEAGAEWEMPHDIAVRVQELADDMQGISPDKKVAELLLQFPEHRYMVRRIQTTGKFAYAEIRDNLVGDVCLPIDMLRFKLAYFGASKFDPKSDRWTRINMYQGAPLAGEMHQDVALLDDWWLPILGPAS